jgi:hypothetical protein
MASLDDNAGLGADVGEDNDWMRSPSLGQIHVASKSNRVASEFNASIDMYGPAWEAPGQYLPEDWQLQQQQELQAQLLAHQQAAQQQPQVKPGGLTPQQINHLQQQRQAQQQAQLLAQQQAVQQINLLQLQQQAQQQAAQ